MRCIRSGQRIWNIDHTGQRPVDGVMSFSGFCIVEVSAGSESRPVYHPFGGLVDWVAGYRAEQVTLALICAAPIDGDGIRAAACIRLGRSEYPHR
jgi:hypothetical protein